MHLILLNQFPATFFQWFLFERAAEQAMQYIMTSAHVVEVVPTRSVDYRAFTAPVSMVIRTDG